MAAGHGRGLGGVAAVHLDQGGQVPVRGGGEHRDHVAESGAVQQCRRPFQDVAVDHECAGPAGVGGALDAVDQQHGLVIGEAVDGGGALHDDVRPGPGGDLADVAQGAGADGDDDVRAGAAGGRSAHGGLVGVDVAGEGHGGDRAEGFQEGR